jgi:hypothetical protein
MTAAQRLSQIFGWAFVIIGVGGFFVTGASMNPDHETAPRLFGLFPVNLLHNFVHLLFGVWGLAAARTFGAAKGYLYGAGGIYLVLALLGIVAPDGFGLVPLGGNDVGLHVFLGVALLGAGLATARGRRDVAA